MSRTPGRTQHLVFFELDEQRRLVDLPGYGYAKVPDKVKQRWHLDMSEYFDNRNCLIATILVMDCRHPLKPFDEMMLQWCVNNDVPTNILLTKSDKLKKGAASSTKLRVIKSLEDLPNINVQLFSSLKKEGILILHRNKSAKEKFPNYFQIIDERIYGVSKVTFGKFLS